MKNVIEMNLEEIRVENDKLYKSFIEKCNDIKPKLREVREKLETTDRYTEEEYYKAIEKRGHKKEDFVYEKYVKYVDEFCYNITRHLSNLSCDETEHSDEFRQDYGNLNKAISQYFDLKASHDYVDQLYDIYADVLNELDK